jgi:hypothetical protein
VDVSSQRHEYGGDGRERHVAKEHQAADAERRSAGVVVDSVDG